MAQLLGSLPDWLEQRARTTPQRLAVACNGRQLTFAALDASVDALAGRLTAAGVQRSEVVAILAANSIEFVTTVHAVARLGAVILPLNLRLTLLEQAWQLQEAAATHLLHDDANAAAANGLADHVPGLTLFSLAGMTGPAPATAAFAAAPSHRGSGFDLASPQGIVFTSGTTGRPKGAILTYGNHFASAVGSALNLGILPDDRWLACLPLFHVGGQAILFRSVIYGIPCLVHEAFDPQQVNRAIDEEGVTIVSVVANMLERMLQARGDQPYPPWLRCVLLGGGPAPRPLLERCAELGVPVVQTYGLTEAASQVTTLAPEDALRKLGSAGKPLFGTEVAIRRADGSGCAAGEAGEIAVRGPTISPGYLHQPAERPDGWFATGDIGYLDAAGYLYVLDRRDDLIVSGGENVYPAEVEAVLQSHPAILEAGVFALPDERWGQSPAAVVVLRPGRTIEVGDLTQFCREHLAAYKVPSRLAFARELPRNAAGKLLRSVLRERWANT